MSTSCFLVNVTVISAKHFHGKAAVSLKHDDFKQRTRESRSHSWNHEFEAMRLSAQDRFRVAIASDSKSEKWDLSVAKLYEKQELPLAASSSRFEHKLCSNGVTLRCRFHISWPEQLAALDVRQKRRHLEGDRRREVILDSDSDSDSDSDNDSDSDSSGSDSEEDAPVIDERALSSIAARLQALGCHEVFWQDLQSLVGWDFVLICDDSGSMNKRTEHGTRWQELKQNVELLVDMCGALDPDGADVLFLNRKGKRGVKTLEQVQKLFRNPPQGRTPLAEALHKAFRLKSESPMIIILATDGEPNDLKAFVKALKNRPNDIYVTILACSDDDDEVGYLNGLDASIDRLDVLDDYASERREVQAVQGAHADYTLGDHCARMLLGSVFEKYDNLDEVKFY